MNLALSDIRVLDLTQEAAGPFASMILADLGAEVIRVEPLTRKSDEPVMTPILGLDCMEFNYHRNKKSLLLNLKKLRGKKVFYELVKKSDVVLDNFRAGVIQKLGIDYSTLSEVNPKVICCSITGYGSTGPYSQLPVYDGIIQAVGGVMSVTGELGRKPLLSGVPVGDFTAPMFAVHGILAALYAREKTGKGQNIEVSMLAAVIPLLLIQLADYFVTNEIPRPASDKGPVPHLSPPYGCFKTEDGYIFIAAQRLFDSFCKAVGREELIEDARFNTAAKRRENEEVLVSIIKEIFLSKDTEGWIRVLRAVDIPVDSVNTVDKVVTDPRVLHLGMMVHQEKAGQQIKIVGNPIKMPGAVVNFQPAPYPGENTEEILSSVLGYTKEMMEELKVQGVIMS